MKDWGHPPEVTDALAELDAMLGQGAAPSKPSPEFARADRERRLAESWADVSRRYAGLRERLSKGRSTKAAARELSWAMVKLLATAMEGNV